MRSVGRGCNAVLRRFTHAGTRTACNVDRLYREAQTAIPFTEHERNVLNNALLQLCNEPKWSRELYNEGVPSFLVSNAAFRDKFIEHADGHPEAKKAIRRRMMSAVTSLHLPSEDNTRPDAAFDQMLEAVMAHTVEFMQQEMPRTMLAMHGARHLADLTNPLDGFPPRPFRRRIVAHLGPPNSGKTHEAYERLREAGSGAYCSPLRLLAWEMHQRLCDAGVKCALLTGQESRSSGADTHLACTVEMTPVQRDFDCAVIDEMQMVGDASRGYAWTRAFLGLRARELHICGSRSCYALAKSLASLAGDSLEVTEHARLGNVSILPEPVSLEQLQPGDCVVCFSRSTALHLVHDIERSCFKNKGDRPPSTAVVYGSLPPETRNEQITDFNARRKQILVASDAIGMGVNVRIKRIIFHTIAKFDGTKRRPLTAAEVQQIAGRAGRYASDCGAGYVGCMRDEDLGYLRRMLRQQQEQLERAVVAPAPQTIAAFADTLQSATDPPASLADALQIYRCMASAGGAFEIFDVRALVTVARALGRVDLPNRVLVEYLFVPLGSQPALQLVLRSFAVSHAVLNSVKIRNVLHQDALQLLDQGRPDGPRGRQRDSLKRLEMLYQILDAYVWLWHKFPEVYVDRHAVEAARGAVAKSLNQQLAEQGVNRESDEHDHEEDIFMETNIARQLISLRLHTPPLLAPPWGPSERIGKSAAFCNENLRTLTCIKPSREMGVFVPGISPDYIPLPSDPIPLGLCRLQFRLADDAVLGVKEEEGHVAQGVDQRAGANEPHYGLAQGVRVGVLDCLRHFFDGGRGVRVAERLLRQEAAQRQKQGTAQHSCDAAIDSRRRRLVLLLDDGRHYRPIDAAHRHHGRADDDQLRVHVPGQVPIGAGAQEQGQARHQPDAGDDVARHQSPVIFALIVAPVDRHPAQRTPQEAADQRQGHCDPCVQVRQAHVLQVQDHVRERAEGRVGDEYDEQQQLGRGRLERAAQRVAHAARLLGLCFDFLGVLFHLGLQKPQHEVSDADPHQPYPDVTHPPRGVAHYGESRHVRQEGCGDEATQAGHGVQYAERAGVFVFRRRRGYDLLHGWRRAAQGASVEYSEGENLLSHYLLRRPNLPPRSSPRSPARSWRFHTSPWRLRVRTSA
ncbi:ATP-dependent RNA helicase [Babesia caballi]|uniref:RNA helicase n=1 Tax=Babesia caballi TaxID=5871 RepID=A0AAV4LRW4_BABCB|nr:ATP-dependent RNA helicase [Babesia caballi]